MMFTLKLKHYEQTNKLSINPTWSSPSKYLHTDRESTEQTIIHHTVQKHIKENTSYCLWHNVLSKSFQNN